MKKVISAVLCGAMLVSCICTASAKNTEPNIEKAYTITVDGKTLDLGNKHIYEKNGNLMVPVRLAAEALGFKVKWDNEKRSAELDNGEVKTDVSIGDDLYCMISSTAIGMSTPTKLGAAPELIDSCTYVPVKMFGILLCDESAVAADGKSITINSDGGNAQIPNPFTERKSLEDAYKALSFKPSVPTKLPDGYETDSIFTVDDDFFQIIYKNGENEIMYRTAKGTEDISGDYNIYKNEKQISTEKYTAKVRGNEKIAGAVWNDGKMTYSLSFSSEVSEDTVISIINNLK